MSKIVWDRSGERRYETGIRHVVLYPKRIITTPFGTTEGYYGPGVAWNGISSISVSSSGGEPQAIWADDGKYLNLLSSEEVSLTIEAYTYPDEFRECDGSLELVEGLAIFQRKRKEFALSFETVEGNDEKGLDYGVKLHVVYGCLAAPTERSRTTINESPEPMTMSWSVSTSPKTMSDGTNVVTMEARSSRMSSFGFRELQDILQGMDDPFGALPEGFSFPAFLPYPDGLIEAILSAEEAEEEGLTGERYSFIYDPSAGNAVMAIRDDTTRQLYYPV